MSVMSKRRISVIDPLDPLAAAQAMEINQTMLKEMKEVKKKVGDGIQNILQLK
jgi:hypothetical protein